MKNAVIDLSDVVKAGSIEAAIHAWAEESDQVSSGVVGMEFATSGPGPGWSKNFGVDDFAERALDSNFGALAYIDADDGRVATRTDEDGTDYDDNDYSVEWSDESMVDLVCPDVEEAIEYPKIFGAMAKAVIAGPHGDNSDVAEWRKLVKEIRETSEALDGIDID